MQLQFISQGESPQQHLDAIAEVCQAGCNWVQLRLKNTSDDTYLATATEALKICKKHDAKLIINDNPTVALKVRSHGVHLGKSDMTPIEARKLFSSPIIIGGTANNWEDILWLSEQKVDYVGLGPFRFTSTKNKLSPTLGIEGYRVLIEKVRKANLNIPIIAIGGIELDDISTIISTGVYGVALSGLIYNSSNKNTMIAYFKKLLNI